MTNEPYKNFGVNSWYRGILQVESPSFQSGKLYILTTYRII